MKVYAWYMLYMICVVHAIYDQKSSLCFYHSMLPVYDCPWILLWYSQSIIISHLSWELINSWKQTIINPCLCWYNGWQQLDWNWKVWIRSYLMAQVETQLLVFFWRAGKWGCWSKQSCLVGDEKMSDENLDCVLTSRVELIRPGSDTKPEPVPEPQVPDSQWVCAAWCV